jgi:hypothetical protein
MVVPDSDVAGIHVGTRGTGAMEAAAMLRPAPAASGSTLIFIRFPTLPDFPKNGPRAKQIEKMDRDRWNML